ncbi:MAG: radical SAM protein [Myxococcales bacterium]|nr:radical SAM protein [Myxococcales bacterium]
MNRVWKHLKYPWRYPGIVPRAAGNYFRLFVLSQPRLRAVEFALTYDCSCRCEHCSAALLKKHGGPLLDTAEVCDALGQLHRLGAMNINLTGGEALLRPDLEAIVRAAHPRSTVVSLATSGVLLTAAVAADLRRWGVRIVTISIDSADPATHDRSRGRAGVFEAAMAATRHCRERGIDVFWCTILTPENAADGDLRRLVDRAGAEGLTITINYPCPVGGWADRRFAITDELRALHAELLRQPHVRWEGHSNFRREGCPAGLEKLYLGPWGDVMPCPFIHLSYGNLRERPLAEIWRTMRSAGTFDTIRDGCPLATDPKFVREMIEPIYRQEEHPMPHTRHPHEGKAGR